MKKLPLNLFFALLTGMVLVQPVQAANRYWVGGSGNWSDTAHWSNRNGGSGGRSVPGSSDRARFTSNSGGGTCTMDQNVNVRGIFMQSGNTTSISQGGSTITVGTQDAIFTSGTFTGGTGSINFNDRFTVNGGTFIAPTATITVSNNATFSSGTFQASSGTLDFNRVVTISGASFTASSGTTSVQRNFTFSSGTFNHNSGTFIFDTTNATLRPGSAEFNDVTFDGTATRKTLASGHTLVVNGNLTFTDIRVNGDATTFIHAKGNLNLDATTDRGTTTITFNGTGNQTVTCSGAAPGGFLTDDVVVDKSSGEVFFTGNCQLQDVSLNTGTLTFQGGATYTIDDRDAITTSAGTTLNFSGSSGSLVTLRSDRNRQWDLDVNASASYTATYVDVEYSDASGGQQIVATFSTDTGNNTNWVFSNVSQLNFTTTEQSIRQNEASAVMTVESQNSSGSPINVSANTVLDLSSSSSGGEFSDTSAFSSTITQVTILSGQSEAEFYYRDSVVGTPTITVSENPSQGWTDATQNVTVISAVSDFLVTASSPQVAGIPFSMTVTALKENGQTATSYSQNVLLTVNYLFPSSTSGTLTTTSTSNFVNGVATISNQNYSECGTIRITAAQSDDSSKNGSSENIFFSPSSFSVGLDDTDGTSASNSSVARHTVNKAFTLNVTALNASGGTCTGYLGAANLRVNNINPSVSQGGTLTPSILGESEWSGGRASVSSVLYDRWGEVTITCFDNNVSAQEGTSGSILFLPKDFLVVPADPPISRTFYYVDEPFDLTLTARDLNDNIVTNYQGTVTFSGESLTLPENYTFLGSDAGVHIFENLSGTLEVSEATITSTDTQQTTVTGVSKSVEVKEASVQVFDNQGPVGNLAVTVGIVDSEGNIITEDDSTMFTVGLEESAADNSATSDTTTTPSVMTEGTSTIIVNDDQAESVTITATSDPALNSITGVATFGTVSGSGLGIQMHREIKDSNDEE